MSLFLCALSLRLAWIWATRSSLPVDDAAWYLSAAQGLFREHAYTSQGIPTAYWPVGYPFFLSLFMGLGSAAGAAILGAQAVLSAWTAVMIFEVASSLRPRTRGAWMAALAFSAFPSALSLSSLYLSETLFTFLLFGAFRAALRMPGRSGVALASMLIAAACYVRPLALLLFPLLYFPVLASGRATAYFARTATVAGVIFLAALPWAYRNYQLFGGLSLYATNLGANLIIGHNPDATGAYMAPAVLDSLERNEPNELRRSQGLQSRAVDYALANPGAEVRLFAVKLFRLLAQERTDVYASFVTGPGRNFAWPVKTLAIANNLCYLAGLALFLSVPFWKRPVADPGLFAFGLAFWIQIGFYTAFFAADRYKFPALPFLSTVISVRLGGLFAPRAAQGSR